MHNRKKARLPREAETSGFFFNISQNLYDSQILKPDISPVNAPVLKRMLTKSLSSKAFRMAKPFILASRSLLRNRRQIKRTDCLSSGFFDEIRKQMIFVRLDFTVVPSCFKVYGHSQHIVDPASA